MTQSIRSTRFGAVLFAGAMAIGAWAQTLEASPAPEVGDKWTYRFHNKGDKREPHTYFNQVKAVDGGSAWIYGESQEANAQQPRYVWRYDIKRSENVERFDFDAAAANGAGKRLINRESVDSWLQFP